jgi:ABC-2 type transport system ATP-binding protein
MSPSVMSILSFQFRQIDRFVTRGEFDLMLLRPLEITFHFSFNQVNVVGFVHLGIGLGYFLYGADLVGFVWTARHVVEVVLVVADGTLIYWSYLMLVSCVAFWTMRSQPLVDASMELMSRGTFYPLTVYPGPLQALLTFVLPLGFIGFYPACDFLGQSARTSLPLDVALWTPVVGGVMLALAVIRCRPAPLRKRGLLMAQIELHQVNKVFRVTRKQRGLGGALRGLLRPERREVHAVRNVSFSIDAGELVGFIGPNGAGKSTTIKMLSGILYPTTGRVSVNGLSPQSDRRAVVQGIGAVFGQRSQLDWDLRLGESFELFKRIYRVTDDRFERSLAELCDVLHIGDLLDTPVRQLSLGQRMRGELAGAMLHEPQILFLDEPTIGMDIEVKASIRSFIRDINRRRSTTVLLTTHDLDDVEALCERLIIINQGEIIEDGPLTALVERITPHRYLLVECEPGGSESLASFTHDHAEVVDSSDDVVRIRFRRKQVSAAALISELSARFPVRDVSVQEADIEEVIRTVYGRGRA